MEDASESSSFDGGGSSSSESSAEYPTRRLVQVAVSSSMRRGGGKFAFSAARTSTLAEVCNMIRHTCELFSPFVVARNDCLLPLSECIDDLLGDNDWLSVQHAYKDRPNSPAVFIYDGARPAVIAKVLGCRLPKPISKKQAYRCNHCKEVFTVGDFSLHQIHRPVGSRCCRPCAKARCRAEVGKSGGEHKTLQRPYPARSCTDAKSREGGAAQPYTKAKSRDDKGAARPCGKTAKCVASPRKAADVLFALFLRWKARREVDEQWEELALSCTSCDEAIYPAPLPGGGVAWINGATGLPFPEGTQRYIIAGCQSCADCDAERCRRVPCWKGPLPGKAKRAQPWRFLAGVSSAAEAVAANRQRAAAGPQWLQKDPVSDTSTLSSLESNSEDGAEELGSGHWEQKRGVSE